MSEGRERNEPRDYAFWTLVEAEAWPHAATAHESGRALDLEQCPHCNAAEHAVQVWTAHAEGRELPELRRDWSPRPPERQQIGHDPQRPMSEGVYRRLLDLAEKGDADVLGLADLMLQDADLREDNDERNRIRDEVNGWLAEWERRFIRPGQLGDVGELVAGDDELLEGVEPDEPEATERLIRRLQDMEGLDLADPTVMASAWRDSGEVDVPDLSPGSQAFRERMVKRMARDIPAMADAAARLVLAASELRHAERMLSRGERNTKFERPLLIDVARARQEIDRALEAINAAIPEARRKR